jgi:hypothetical protein
MCSDEIGLRFSWKVLLGLRDNVDSDCNTYQNTSGNCGVYQSNIEGGYRKCVGHKNCCYIHPKLRRYGKELPVKEFVEFVADKRKEKGG